MARLRSSTFVILLGTLLLAGCGVEDKPGREVAAPATNVETEVSRAPVYSAPAKPEAVVNPAGQPDFSAMNREVRRWILKNQRPPKSFEEFSASAGVQFPPPPAGKKYAIDKSMHVVLVNN